MRRRIRLPVILVQTRTAAKAGLDVTLALDAMTDFGTEAHRHSVEHIFPRPGGLGAAEEIIPLPTCADAGKYPPERMILAATGD
jgi:isochorismate hydrolase